MTRGDDPSALILADRLACLGTLVAGVAHEVNNPITYVVGNLGELRQLCDAMRDALVTYERLVRQLPDGDAFATSIEAKLDQAGGLDTLDEVVSDALEGAGRVRDLIRDLLVLAHPGDPTRPGEGLDPHTILDSSLRLVSRRLEGVAVLRREYRATSSIAGDRTRLGQVCLNLLTNAIDACTAAVHSESGAVSDASRDPSPEIVVRTRDADGALWIEVEDSGIGITPEVGRRVFEPFFTTKRVGEGNGLGLHISQRIIESHGGTLDYRPRAGGGTTFRVVLPAQPGGEADS